MVVVLRRFSEVVISNRVVSAVGDCETCADRDEVVGDEQTGLTRVLLPEETREANSRSIRE
ncbi:hypothetical protein [Haladaptatus halobius]|uniref:hypothetical protein n=1 Tax=Haladaptatus halobius TaxID=2884875 RepID=UPI001D0BDE0C|nr:hypothetical protein [Haladaptatus halobius]